MLRSELNSPAICIIAAVVMQAFVAHVRGDVPAGRPNIIFIMADENDDNVGCVCWNLC